MARVEGAKDVIVKLERLKGKSPKYRTSVAVGYTAKYALWVHESVEERLKGVPRPSGIGNYWGPRGRSKYLEGPFRELAPTLAEIVRTAIIRNSTLPQALLLAGLRLQRESQQVVPVEYGLLRASAFTKLETGRDSFGG